MCHSRVGWFGCKKTDSFVWEARRVNYTAKLQLSTDAGRRSGVGCSFVPPMELYFWWKKIWHSPVDMENLSLLRGVLCISGVCLEFLNHQDYFKIDCEEHDGLMPFKVKQTCWISLLTSLDQLNFAMKKQPLQQARIALESFQDTTLPKKAAISKDATKTWPPFGMTTSTGYRFHVSYPCYPLHTPERLHYPINLDLRLAFFLKCTYPLNSLDWHMTQILVPYHSIALTFDIFW